MTRPTRPELAALPYAPIHNESPRADLLNARADAVDAVLSNPTPVACATLSAIDSIILARGLPLVYRRVTG